MAYDPVSVASFYATTFAARTDVYSRWTSEGWRPIREPLTGGIALAGLTGAGPSISGYMIAPGSTSHVVAFDFDTDDGLAQGLTLATYMELHALPAYVETSRRGSHLWCVLDHAVPAIAARAAARGLLQNAGLPDDPHIEIRPGSDSIADEGLGHALRMPLMPHPKTGKRGQLLHPTGEPLAGSLADMLLEIRWASSGLFLDWGQRWRRPPVSSLPPTFRTPRVYPEDDASATELLQTLWGAVDAVPGKVISCPATAYHKNGDRHKGCRVFPDDRRVICHTIGCILWNDGRGRGTYELRKLAPSQGA